MGSARQSDRRIWAISAAVALVTAVAAAFLVALPARKPPMAARVGGNLGLQKIEGNKMLAEQTELGDPMPLFLPVGMNSRPGGGPVSARDLESDLQLARPFSGRLAYREESATVEFAPRVTVPVRLVDALSQDDADAPFLGMGRNDRSVSIPDRAAYIEVVSDETGKSMITEAIQGGEVSSASDWQPFELRVIVDRVGMVATSVSRTSTVDAVDGFFREYLDKGIHLGQRLPPGSYLVMVGR